MFYNGDLQSGIAKAVQESKLVACFVTDNGEESKLWEEDYLQEKSLKSSLADQAIVLRLAAGSQEAGFLAAIYPLPKTPTLVIIKNGDLKEYITSGVTKDEFLRRLRIAFQSTAPVQTPSPPDPSSSSSTPATVATPSTQRTQPASTNRSPQTTTTPPVSPTQQDPRVQSMLAERAARLEADKKEKEAAEKAQCAADAKARKATMESESPAGTSKSADMKYALQQKRRQQDARAERERILKRVEDDKAERREREAQRKAQAKAKAKEDAEKGVESEAPTSSVKPLEGKGKGKGTECAIQVRLFDGSSIRSRFPSSGSLREHVRPWIDGQQGGDTPYTFKHVLTPLPNKNISISDEEQTLQSQGLTPSATLILIPVQGYTSAYEDGAGAGIFSRVASGGYGLVSSGLGMASGVLGSFLGGGAAQPTAQERQEMAPVNMNPAADLRTLRERERDDQQFYNGNALNFEPRKDDDKKED